MLNASCRPRRKRLSWESRCEIVAKVVEQGLSPEEAAASSGVHRSTVYRLLERFRTGGWQALVNRPCTPRRQPRRLPPAAEDEIVAARARSGYGPLRLAGVLDRPASTIGKAGFTLPPPAALSPPLPTTLSPSGFAAAGEVPASS